MTAFDTRPVPRHGFKRCENGCLTVGNYPAKATTSVAIAGHPTLLCDRCVRAWRQIWEGARDADPEAVAA